MIFENTKSVSTLSIPCFWAQISWINQIKVLEAELKDLLGLEPKFMKCGHLLKNNEKPWKNSTKPLKLTKRLFWVEESHHSSPGNVWDLIGCLGCWHQSGSHSNSEKMKDGRNRSKLVKI